MKKLTELTSGEVQSKILAMNRSDRDSVKRFYDGDHWQSQLAYVGPQALESDGTVSSAGMDVIKGKFVFENMIAEIVGRHVSGVLGEQPHWQVTPKKPTGENGTASEIERKKSKDAEDALTTWMDSCMSDYTSDEDKLDPITQFCVNLLLFDRAVMRVFVPESISGNVSAPTMEEALSKLYFHAPEITQAGVVTDKNTQEKLGAYYWSDTETDYFESTYRVGGVTFLRTVINNVESITQHNMRGRLFIYEARRPRFVKESIISLQKTLNMVLTMLGRNVNVGGSPETFFLNAMLPGKTKIVDGKQQYVADPVQVGAGTVISVSGIPVRDPVTGSETFTTPNVTFRDPVPVDTFTNSENALRYSILAEAQQLHAIITGDAAVSGESRIQALADFENSLKQTAKAMNSMLQWLFETALSLASTVMGTEGEYDDYRVVVQCNTNAGPLSAEMLRTIADVKDKNFISHETGLALARVQDVEAEIQRVNMEKQKAMDEQQQYVDINAKQAQNTLNQIRQPRQAQSNGVNQN